MIGVASLGFMKVMVISSDLRHIGRSDITVGDNGLIKVRTSDMKALGNYRDHLETSDSSDTNIIRRLHVIELRVCRALRRLRLMVTGESSIGPY